jgi:hypothetical protein
VSGETICTAWRHPDGRLAPKDGELMAQRHNLHDKIGLRTNRGTKSGDQSDHNGDHNNR